MTIAYEPKKLYGLLQQKDGKILSELRQIERCTYSGLLPVGLKIHSVIGDERLRNFIHRLANKNGGRQNVEEVNYYRRVYHGDEDIPFCWVLHPVGSAHAAIKLIEAIEVASNVQLFDSPDIQIQVCSPGRLDHRAVALLSIGFYLGTDVLRMYTLDEMTTTFSDLGDMWCLPQESRARRMVLYDAQGEFDPNFDWYGYDMIERTLPFEDRTDILCATSKTDIHNINLLATLLVHARYGGRWYMLGKQLEVDLCILLQDHQLDHILDIDWVYFGRPCADTDERYMVALDELMAIAFNEQEAIRDGNLMGRGLLGSINDLLVHYRKELYEEFGKMTEVY